MCYGSQEQVSSIVRQYVEREGGIGWVTGRHFWEFISDDPRCIDEVYQIAGEVGEEFRDAQGQTLAEILNAKINELQKRFEQLYGKKGSTIWQNLLKHNT